MSPRNMLKKLQSLSIDCMMNSIVNIYKPAGPSSFSMVQSVKNTLNVKKAGHIGTLDPLAEGVLPICLNRSTKIIQFLTRLNKSYTATMKLGESTDTQDSTGKIISLGDANNISSEDIKKVLKNFIGKQQQTPPMFSAKKKNGVPLYKLARNGITINRDPVTVDIYSIEFLNKDGNQVTFRVVCSAGTYVRTLCHDVGLKLGCGAHLTQLVREQVGHFNVQSSITLEELNQAQAQGTLTEKLLKTEQALDFLPEISIFSEEKKPIVNGLPILKRYIKKVPSEFYPGMNLRVLSSENDLIAIVDPLVNQEEFKNIDSMKIAFKLKRVLV